MRTKISFRLCSALLILTILVISCAAIGLNASAATAQSKTVAFTNPAIPANTGDTVTLSEYGVEFSASNTVSNDRISWTSEDITITDGKVTPTKKGVYKLSASDGSSSKTVYLVVKAPADMEYVLYEDDFSSDTLSSLT